MDYSVFCDAHIHLSHCKIANFSSSERYFSVSSCHSKEDFESLGRYGKAAFQPPLPSGFPPFANAHSSPFCGSNFGATIPTAFASYGIHPQSPSLKDNNFIKEELSFIENLLIEKKIIAIGECGFDFFTPEFKSTAQEQEIVFNEQLFLAQKYNVPLVLHLRKSIEKIFSYSMELKKLPAVIFHSFPGTLLEARSLMNHGIKAYFSFGKPILNGKKSAIDCVKNLPEKNLLFETDAPYQTLKGEDFTRPEEIKIIYKKACEIRGETFDELTACVFENFSSAYGLFLSESPSVEK